MKNIAITAITAAVLSFCPACDSGTTTRFKHPDAAPKSPDSSTADSRPPVWTVPDTMPCGFLSPTTGKYKGTSAEIGADGGYQTFPGFDLMQAAAAGSFYVRFSVDGYRYDNIPVTCGSFGMIHGCGYDGTSYPTDGYKMYGSFFSAIEARGYFAHMAGCEVVKEYEFSVTLRPGAEY